ncbi:glutamyl-tRNA(Gln) amidotransferase subunit A [Puia dinghuensis]|uniref:Glutamyl-tRNA(Gln) amidotransferase subunit A n=2 Tax=Puia dinghuensis TaxID=1792502 RepID=A0A8J2UF23_9BACT|nr:glutamyl-tRNA(Gln) amidotransferase subunit A [Puia dinghuensis]
MAIEQQQPLNAYIRVYSKEALAKARLLDQQRKEGKPMGKLHGVVIGLKDVIAYKDHPLTAASHILQDYVSIYNATAVDKMLAEEAILIGHLNCDEFAMGSSNENSAYGKVLNARCNSRVPGGSSGGSAVAVQAGLCMVSLGSDTGGSVRQPADFCGILGLKPTYGRVSRYGLIAYASSFDQIGIFAHTIGDVALLLEVIAGVDEFDSTVKKEKAPVWKEAPDQKYRIAYFKEALDHPGLDPEIREAILTRTEQWRQAGHTIEAIDFELLGYIVPAYYVLTTAEASSNLARFDGVRYGYRTKDKDLELTEFYKRTRSEGFGREVKRRILLGTFVLSAGYYDAYFTKAQQVRQLLVERTNLIFKNFDIIILPTAPTTAWRIGEKMDDPIAMYLADIYTVYANLTGIPGISIPLFGHTNGMPFGVQAMTSHFNEVSLLQFSHQMMQQ